MKKINLKRFLGFYNQKKSFMKIGAYCHNPVKHLKTSTDSHDDLVCIITLIQRFVFLARAVDLFVSKGENWLFELILTGIIILFSRQIAQLLLFINGRVIHILMRLFFRRNDLEAAERSHAYSSIALDPTYFLIYFAISFDSTVYSIIKPFYLLLLATSVCIILKAINIAVLYKINFYLMAFATLLVSVLVFSVYPTFYIPCFLSIHLSPEVLEDDVDLSVLDYRHVDIDSSYDGSTLLNYLEPLPETETAIIDSIYKNRNSIKTFDIPFMNKRLRALEPFWNVTYFNQRHLPKWAWHGEGDTLHGIIDLEPFNRIKPYLTLSVLKIKHLISINDYETAVIQIKKSLQLFTSVSKSNLGLVWSIIGAAYYNNILLELKPHVNELNDFLILHELANSLSSYPINVEWVINSIRQEAHHGADNTRNDYFKSEDTLKFYTDSVGYYIPGFLKKKWMDPEETYLIMLHTWARKISKSYQRQKITKEELKEINKILSWTKSKWLGINKFVLYPNSIGRILACVAIPNYEGYIRSTEDIRRHQEFILLAIALRYYMIQNSRQPETLTQIDSTLQMLHTFELQTTYSFNYDSDNKIFTSKDTIPDRDVYTINF